jgi:anti-sigma factor RsiW
MLLPWYANDTLSKAERQRVDRHLKTCSACQRELAQVQTLEQAVLQSHETIPEPSPDALERVLTQIEGIERIERIEREQKRSQFWDRLRSFIPSAPFSARRVAGALAAIVIVLQAAAIVGMLGERSTEPGSFRTLSGAEESVGTDAPRIIIAFAGSASQGEVQALLQSLDANIIKGPTPQGTFVVEIHTALESPAAIERILNELRAKPEIVRFAEKAF